VPGENLPHVSHYFDEAHLCTGLDVAVIGAKNTAVEAALSLFRAGARVTMIIRGRNVGETVKYWMRPDIENRIRQGDISALMCAEVIGIQKRHVVARDVNGNEVKVPADRVYALTGFLPDTDLFRRVGIEIEPVTGRPQHNPETHETNVPGVFVAGSICAGYRTSDIFIENGRFDGEKIFSGVATR
jgi:thioredoxin reductase (NADPH)